MTGGMWGVFELKFLPAVTETSIKNIIVRWSIIILTRVLFFGT